MSYDKTQAQDINQSKSQRLHWPNGQEHNGRPLRAKQNKRHTVSKNNYNSRGSTDCNSLCKGARSDGEKRKNKKRMSYRQENCRTYYNAYFKNHIFYAFRLEKARRCTERKKTQITQKVAAQQTMSAVPWGYGAERD
eukprot:7835208-Heterocapsa_arctica.AAC.1